MKNIIVAILISYLIGNFASAYILGKLFKKTDIREYGSKNAGATNALRVFGKTFGALALLLDVFKGVLAVYVGGRLVGYNGKLIAGLSVVLGHNYPILLGFKGGKGIATSIGVLLSIHWPTGILCILVGLITILVSKYVSLGSIVAAASVPFIGLITMRPFNRNFFMVLLALGILAIHRHRSNIKRLINGTEFKVGERIK